MNAHNALLELGDDQDVIHDMIEYVPFMYDQDGDDAEPTSTPYNEESQLQVHHETLYTHGGANDTAHETNTSAKQVKSSDSGSSIDTQRRAKRTRLEREQSLFEESATINQESTRPTQWGHSSPRQLYQLQISPSSDRPQTDEPLRRQPQGRTKLESKTENRIGSSHKKGDKDKIKRDSFTSSKTHSQNSSLRKPVAFRQGPSTGSTVSVTSLFSHPGTRKPTSSSESSKQTSKPSSTTTKIKATAIGKKSGPISHEALRTPPPRQEKDSVSTAKQPLTKMFDSSSTRNPGKGHTGSSVYQRGAGTIPILTQKWEASKRTRQHDVVTLRRKTDFTNAMHAECDCTSRFPSKGCVVCNTRNFQWSSAEPVIDSTSIPQLWTTSRLKRPWILLKCLELHTHSRFCLARCTVLDCPPPSVQTSAEPIKPDMQIHLVCSAGDVSQSNVMGTEAFRLWAPWTHLKSPSASMLFVIGSELVPV